MSRGCLSAQIYQSGTWAAALTGTASGTSNVASSSTRYITDLFTAIETAWSATTTDTITVTGSFGESGTGLVTITSTANLAVTWTSTDLRDLLGFTGNLSAATSHVGTRQCKAVWLPNAEGAFYYGNGDEGHTETDAGTTESPRGDVKTLVYNTRQVLPSALWSHVPKANARIAAESTVGASFEQWWRNTQGAELGYFEARSAVRLIWDANTAGTYKTYRLPALTSTQMTKPVEGWNGVYTIEIPRLVRVPGT